ncbi:death effector domain-containing 1 isoform 2-T2 [Lycodopsis pacificus]
MAAVHHPGCPLRDSLYWDETECLNYYGMLSLHEVFEVVGCQLTETDIEVLSFLLNETCPATHPLDPTDWTVKPCGGDPDDLGVSPSPELLKAWMRLKSRGSQRPLAASYKPKSGLELLLELDRRGYLSDGNLEPLLQLLRVLTRHDLLPLVSHKKRRTVSPERVGRRNRIENNQSVCASGMQHSYRQTEIPHPYFPQPFRTGIGRRRGGTAGVVGPRKQADRVPHCLHHHHHTKPSAKSACVSGPNTWSMIRHSARASRRTSGSPWSVSSSCSAKPTRCFVPETWVPSSATSTSQSWRTSRPSGVTT